MNKDMSINIREFYVSEIREYQRQEIDDIDYWSEILRLKEVKEKRMSSIDVYHNDGGKHAISVAFQWNEKGDEFHLTFFPEALNDETKDICTVLIQMAKAVANINGVSRMRVRPPNQLWNWYKNLNLGFEEDDNENELVIKFRKRM